MVRKKDTRARLPNTGNEEVPPGATAAAADRPVHSGGGGAPGSGAGPRHASNDAGSAEEEYGPVDSNVPEADGTDTDLDAAPPGYDEQQEGYGGPSGGAVGGTPAGKRSSGGRHGRGIRPGTARPGDSTVGADPERPTE